MAALLYRLLAISGAWTLFTVTACYIYAFIAIFVFDIDKPSMRIVYGLAAAAALLAVAAVAAVEGMIR